jgi:murein DD-endopeptidase MepM/ murein hydrolase activator NlpD
MRRHSFVLLIVVGLVWSLVGQAGATGTDVRAQREAARARRTQLARDLNALKASEDELLEAADALDDEVLAAAAQVDASRQAFAASEAELRDAQASLTETSTLIDKLNAQVIDRALEQYMEPDVDEGVGLDQTNDLAEVARAQVMLSVVAISDKTVLDQLRAAKEDYERQRQAAEAAAARAKQRKDENESRLKGLERARSDQRRIAAAVTQRQREVLAEIDEQSKVESELTRIINARARTASVDGGGAPGSSSGCIWPVRGRMTSGFGSRWGRLHAGIDIAAPTGTPIWAAKAGEVIFAGVQSGYGNVVIIDHGGGLTTLYGHQSRIGVHDGQTVGQGEVIGAVGSTGRSTGPHLHFETRYGGAARNPQGCLG